MENYTQILFDLNASVRLRKGVFPKIRKQSTDINVEENYETGITVEATKS